ncbi:glucose ABC transporter substrate-binding protein GlcS [Picrophilus oshimae]|uniref:Carbohydrate ABC transporter substrate-binding protein, CUT1 family n=1 Tax=Picrophilus torridus (strain ATCC 700027 / DSM 9790 / JCM 10055 / NBRC 100828 / KAW 2/3) TaxID=1122961 RepID=A0A8G2FWW1_PICTO|nr:glucose ABC transporter substrate-binding protein GlcS [Picrophilus oshimae]SMD30953.1 carbohydrate ABC transporter substrate-binding protein, CUT1 family [Picrophilus oshimae DSM 9789]
MKAPEEYKGKQRKPWVIPVVIVVVIVVIGLGVYFGFVYHPPKKVKTIYFYTWWATEGKIAVDKEYAAFHHAYPQYAVKSELKPGAGGTEAIYAILADIKAGHPPDAFQAHFGPQLISYIEDAPNGAKDFVNMTPIAQKMGLFSNAVTQVLMAGTYNGTMFSLPVDVHRGAMLYFNPQVLIKYGLPLPNNLTTLIHDSEVLHSKGVSAWAVPGDDGGWDEFNLWEDIFLSVTGNGTLYDEAMYGVLNLSNPTILNYVNEASKIFQQFTSYGYSGESSQTWTQAIPKVIDGQAVFQANGNWYCNYAYDFDNTTTYPNAAPYNNTSYIMSHDIKLMSMPFPGTSRYYVLVDDSVVVPAGPSQNEGLTFAEYFSSYSGQLVFTKWKAVTFYKNITNDYYNTPGQWYNYESLLNHSSNAHSFLYQLSDGGFFAGPYADLDSAFLATIYAHPNVNDSSARAAFVSDLKSTLAKEKSDWLKANSLGYGFMGTLSDPFGGYLPPWVNNTSASVITSNAVSDNSNVNSTSTFNGNIYSTLMEFLDNVIAEVKW